MAERATTANKRSNIVLRRTLPALMAAIAVWALVSSFFALDITEYGLVTRFGRVVRVVADLARTAYGIDVVSVDIRSLHLPELNREHVFERMRAERAKIAKENRSAGELEAKRILAEADHEKTRIDSEAAGQAERIKAEADAEASRTYAAAFWRDPGFYQFLRTLRAYDKFLDDKTTLFLPTDADVLRMLHFDTQPVQIGPSPPAPGAISTDLLLNKKPEEEVR